MRDELLAIGIEQRVRILADGRLHGRAWEATLRFLEWRLGYKATQSIVSVVARPLLWKTATREFEGRLKNVDALEGGLQQAA